MKFVANAVYLLVLLSLCGLSQALPDDRNQPIYIESDSAERDENQGITTYSGDVKIRQGSLKINADKVALYNREEQLSKIVASGGKGAKRARLEQKPNLEEAPVVARGERITYFLNDQQEQVIIEHDASLKQTGRSFAGERIDYDVSRAVVKAVGGEKVEGQPDSGRIKMVLPPMNQTKKTNPTEKSD